eukprot:CAMPEP_0119363528 /NCGR_PEP_ID=MMETSP1334-20130426/10433_1 /TAXON_ID=127549 /ORGANISM="Calcidiscus leptoporus, Strain RCC1130" /LENGTH=133 /DNA_ID=CAMNT_0007379003 /DNA_START=761 /DNA_END=1162 /DNA_ORIENTATION=+
MTYAGTARCPRAIGMSSLPETMAMTSLALLSQRLRAIARAVDCIRAAASTRVRAVAGSSTDQNSLLNTRCHVWDACARDMLSSETADGGDFAEKGVRERLWLSVALAVSETLSAGKSGRPRRVRAALSSAVNW